MTIIILIGNKDLENFLDFSFKEKFLFNSISTTNVLRIITKNKRIYSIMFFLNMSVIGIENRINIIMCESVK